MEKTYQRETEGKGGTLLHRSSNTTGWQLTAQQLQEQGINKEVFFQVLKSLFWDNQHLVQVFNIKKSIKLIRSSGVHL